VPEPSLAAVLASTQRRVLAVKLADRLHNMQTIDFMRVEIQRRKSRETLAFLVPLAGRLGFDGVQTELEDLAIATLVRTV
jgi:GTP pyrophosphokinase